MSRHAHIKRAKVLRGFWKRCDEAGSHAHDAARFRLGRRRRAIGQAICSGYPRGKK